MKLNEAVEQAMDPGSQRGIGLTIVIFALGPLISLNALDYALFYLILGGTDLIVHTTDTYHICVNTMRRIVPCVPSVTRIEMDSLF